MTSELADVAPSLGAVQPELSAPSPLAQRLARLRALDGRLLTAAQLPVPGDRRLEAEATAAARRARLAAAVGGVVVERASGAVVEVERDLHLPFDPAPLRALPIPVEEGRPLFLLDTETTGLGSGAGTLAFLVGLGWWQGRRLRVRQWWVADHADEPALLEALTDALPRHAWLVTYNGRAFDWPLLVARYRLHRHAPPPHAGHLDLLPVARQLWRHRLPDARLASVEAGVAGVRRAADLPGALVPERYLAFLRHGDPRGLALVGEHNRQDIVSLGRLLVVLAEDLGRPQGWRAAPTGDLVALGRALRRAGRPKDALACLEAGLHRPLAGQDMEGRGRRQSPFVEASLERALLLRRLGRSDEAVEAWRAIAAGGGRTGILAWIALAKEMEHGARDLRAALEATRRAEELLARRRSIGLFCAEAERDLPRRRARLIRRLVRRQRLTTGPASTGGGAPPDSGPAGESAGDGRQVRHALEAHALDDQGGGGRGEAQLSTIDRRPGRGFPGQAGGDESGQERVAGPCRVQLPGARQGSVAAQSWRSMLPPGPGHQAPLVAGGDDQLGLGVQHRQEGLDRQSMIEVVAADPDDLGPPDEGRGLGRSPLDPPPRLELAEEPLPAEDDPGSARRHPGPGVVDLAGDGDEHPPRRRGPRLGHRGGGQVRAGVEAGLDAAAVVLHVLEHRAVSQPHEPDHDPRPAEEVQLPGVGGGLVDPHQSGRG